MNIDDIKISEIRKMDLKDCVVIDGFPSVGLVSSIVANYLIDTLKLTQIGVVDSIYFPAVSIVRNWEPFNPVRIYGGLVGEKEKVVVFLSEFQMQTPIIKALASIMLDWAEEQKARLIITPEGIQSTKIKPSGKVNVYSVATTQKAKELIPDELLIFEEGVINGVTGVLLNEGKKREMDVIALLAEAHEEYPDARAAGRIIEILSSKLLNVKIDPKPLYKEAQKIEKQLHTIRKQTEKIKTDKPKGYMYS